MHVADDLPSLSCISGLHRPCEFVWFICVDKGALPCMPPAGRGGGPGAPGQDQHPAGRLKGEAGSGAGVAGPQRGAAAQAGEGGQPRACFSLDFNVPISEIACPGQKTFVGLAGVPCSQLALRVHACPASLL